MLADTAFLLGRIYPGRKAADKIKLQDANIILISNNLICLANNNNNKKIQD